MQPLQSCDRASEGSALLLLASHAKRRSLQQVLPDGTKSPPRSGHDWTNLSRGWQPQSVHADGAGENFRTSWADRPKVPRNRRAAQVWTCPWASPWRKWRQWACISGWSEQQVQHRSWEEVRSDRDGWAGLLWSHRIQQVQPCQRKSSRTPRHVRTSLWRRWIIPSLQFGAWKIRWSCPGINAINIFAINNIDRIFSFVLIHDSWLLMSNHICIIMPIQLERYKIVMVRNHEVP